MADEIRFEWDARKALANERKHGIAFALATLVFEDKFADRKIEGDDHGEIRWQALGQVGRTLIRVSFTTRDEEGVEVVRIISARKATRSERRDYEGDS